MGSDPEDGYATPVAAVICLALSVVAAATVVRSMGELKLAKADLARSHAEYSLESAQQSALISIATSSRPPPYHWTLASLGEAIDVVAEPERPKMSAASAAAAPDEVLAALGAADPSSVRARLQSLATGQRLSWVADAGPTELWRQCAPVYLSAFGAAAQPTSPTYKDPASTQQSGLSRAGEVWRIVASDAVGWRDERIVRFTGDGLHPAAVLGRRLSKHLKGQQTCEGLFSAAAGA